MMSLNLYPECVEYDWLASDCENHVAVFSSAGHSPIPSLFLKDEICRDYDCADDIETLPKSDTAIKELSGDLSSFISYGKKGLFVFDAGNCPRIYKSVKCQYEKLITPITPVLLSALPKKMRYVAGVIHFKNIKFSEEDYVDIIRHVDSCFSEALGYGLYHK